MDADFSLLNNDFEDVFCTPHQIQLRSPFRLFDLPPELWLRVCEFAVLKPSPIRVGREPNLKDQVAVTQQPAITRTCRLLRHEALPVFYALNTFEMLHHFGVPCPRKWIEAIGCAHRKRMKSVLMCKYQVFLFNYMLLTYPAMASEQL